MSKLQQPAEAHVAAQAMPRKMDTCDVPTWGTPPSQLRMPAVSTCSTRQARLLARCEKTTHISRTGDACADTPIAMVTLYEPL